MPKPWRQCGIDPWGMALVIGLGCFDPTGVNGPSVLVFGPGDSPGIKKLDFVAALQVDAGVGALGQHELQFEVHVAVFQLAVQVCFGLVTKLVAEVVEEDSATGLGTQQFILGTSAGFTHDLPTGGWGAKTREVVEGQVAQFVKGILSRSTQHDEQKKKLQGNSVMFWFVDSH